MIENLDDMIHSEGYQNYASDTVYSLQDHCINNNYYDTDPDTMDECNSEGMFGVTHNDVIKNQRNYLNNNKREMFGPCDCDDDTCEACASYAYIDNEINELEEWHIENGSINEIIQDSKKQKDTKRNMNSGLQLEGQAGTS